MSSGTPVCVLPKARKVRATPVQASPVQSESSPKSLKYRANQSSINSTTTNNNNSTTAPKKKKKNNDSDEDILGMTQKEHEKYNESSSSEKDDPLAYKRIDVTSSSEDEEGKSESFDETDSMMDVSSPEDEPSSIPHPPKRNQILQSTLNNILQTIPVFKTAASKIANTKQKGYGSLQDVMITDTEDESDMDSSFKRPDNNKLNKGINTSNNKKRSPSDDDLEDIPSTEENQVPSKKKKDASSSKKKSNKNAPSTKKQRLINQEESDSMVEDTPRNASLRKDTTGSVNKKNSNWYSFGMDTQEEKDHEGLQNDIHGTRGQQRAIRQDTELENERVARQTIQEKIKECIPILEPLMNAPLEADPNSNFPPAKLEELLETLEKLWIPSYVDGPRALCSAEIIAIMEACLNITSKEDPTPFMVENLMDKFLLEPIHNLNFRFSIADMIRNESYERSREFETRFQRLFMMMSYGMELYYNLILYRHRARNPDLDFSESSIGLLRYLPRSECDQFKDSTKFLLYCLLTLQTRRYRRYKGAIYRPIYNREGYYTNAWEWHMTVEDFVYSVIHIDRQQHIFALAYAKHGTVEMTIKILKHIKTAYFPDLDMDRYRISFANGIYDIAENKFFPYIAGTSNPFTQGVRTAAGDTRVSSTVPSEPGKINNNNNFSNKVHNKSKEPDFVIDGVSIHDDDANMDDGTSSASQERVNKSAKEDEDAEDERQADMEHDQKMREAQQFDACIDELEKVAGMIPKYKATFSAIQENIRAKKQQCMSDSDGTFTGGKDRKATPGSEFLEGLDYDDDTKSIGLMLGGNFCSSIFINQQFTLWEGSVKDAKGRFKKHHWRAIPTPAFEKVLESQKFSQNVKDWLYALCGRGLFWCGHMNKENWQIAVMLLGYGGTGKSTILKCLRQFFRMENVGILSNNIERTWAMSSLEGKQIIIGSEVKKDFKWDQAEFNQCAACEELLVAKKNQQAFITQFRSPIYLACNEFPSVWREASNSLGRRMVIFPFRHFVHAKDIDPNLMEQLEAEAPLLLQKFNMAYREFTSLYAHKDIWSVLPEELKSENKRIMQTVHELQHFFQDQMQSGKIHIDPDNPHYHCTWSEFWGRFKEWCPSVGYDYHKIRILDDYWRPVFSTQGLEVRTLTEELGTTNPDQPGGAPKPKGPARDLRYIVGIHFAEDEDIDPKPGEPKTTDATLFLNTAADDHYPTTAAHSASNQPTVNTLQTTSSSSQQQKHPSFPTVRPGPNVSKTSVTEHDLSSLAASLSGAKVGGILGAAYAPTFHPGSTPVVSSKNAIGPKHKKASQEKSTTTASSSPSHKSAVASVGKSKSSSATGKQI